MKFQLRVYIAGPIMSHPNSPFHGVSEAIEAMHSLMDHGYHPFCPHLNALADMVMPRPETDWMALDLEWLRSCDAILCLDKPKKGSGVQQEVDLAAKMGIPVHFSLWTLNDWRDSLDYQGEPDGQ